MSPYTYPGLPNRLPLKAEWIINEVLQYRGGTTLEAVNKRNRKREIVYTRQLIMFFLKERTKLSLKDIGGLIGGRDHTTVIHSCQTIIDLAQTDAEVRTDLNQIMKRFI